MYTLSCSSAGWRAGFGGLALVVGSGERKVLTGLLDVPQGRSRWRRRRILFVNRNQVLIPFPLSMSDSQVTAVIKRCGAGGTLVLGLRLYLC